MSVVELALVRFPNEPKKYIFNTKKVFVKEGDEVVVDTARGHQLGTVVCKALVTKGSDIGDLINEWNNKREIKPILCNVSQSINTTPISLGDTEVEWD